MNIAMSDKKKDWILQLVTLKRINFAKECCNEWVSLKTTDNYWKVLPSEIKIKIDKIIVCSEIPFSKNSYQIVTSQLICKES